MNNGSNSYDIICIGTAIVDSIIRGFDPEPVSASGFRAESGALFAGGEAVNASVAAAKLGNRTGILCCLGNDAAGGIIESELRRWGVDTGLILHDEEHPTPVTTMFVRNDGTRRSITNTAHRYNFHPEKYCACMEKTRAVILGSLFRAPFDDPLITAAVIGAARANGVITAADTKLPNFRFLTLSDLSETLPMIDYLTPNEDEARYFTGKEEPEEMADVILEAGVSNVIIKLGSRGCLFKNRQETIRLPAYPIRAVDSTGAGDHFIAGFVTEILNGKTTEEALRFASACGAVCTTAAGAGTALRDRQQVYTFMAQNELPRA